MTVIAMVGNKGGAGKTTLAVNLACALNAVAPTAILDADPQGSALQWRAIAERTDMPDVFASARQMEAVPQQSCFCFSRTLVARRMTFSEFAHFFWKQK